MKALALFTLTAVASASVLAAGSSPAAKIVISGDSSQSTSVAKEATVSNQANAYATAVQNLSSNKGDITIAGDSKQSTTVKAGGNVSNKAWNPGDIALQSVASNVGKVEVKKGASSTQSATIAGTLSNDAMGAGSPSSTARCSGRRGRSTRAGWVDCSPSASRP